MDQVRVIVKVLWVQRFWVLSVICAITGTVCWNMAASDVSAEFKKRKSTIDGAFSAVSGIRNEATHPNDDVNAGDLAQAKLQRDYVRNVWQELYQDQREKVIYWPKTLGDNFLEKIEGLKFGDKISPGMRDRYLNYIEKRFDALLEIVKALKIEGRGSRGGPRSFGGGDFGDDEDAEEEEGEDYLVQWLDQEKLKKKLFFEKKPSDMQVWVTQEDLWVYETLLDVIAKTNQARGATRPENTAVRVIVSMGVGSEVSLKSKTGGKVYIPQSAAGGGGEFGGGFGDEYGGRGSYGGDEFGGGFDGGEYGGSEYGRGGSADVSDTALLANRYLDAEGNPDPAESGTFGTTEYRQLPIQMTLMMDQRWIPQVLIECANAALPVEVKQLRINPSQSASSGFGGRSGRRARRPSKALRGLTPDPNLAEVEIHGAVYIYNEPDPNSLRIPGDEEAVDDSI